MLADYTYLSILLDESGSMSNVRSQVISGINELLDEQAKSEKPVNVSINKFSTAFRELYSDVPASAAAKLSLNTYYPMGGTALYDSVAKVIDDMGAKFSKLPENQRPARVVLVIYSDGEENASREYSPSSGGLARIKEKIKHQQDVYNWQILFLGADLSEQVGFDMGINSSFKVYKQNTSGNINAVSRAVCSYSMGNTEKLEYTVPGESS